MSAVALPSQHANALHKEQGAGGGLASQALHDFSHPGDAIPFSALNFFPEPFIRYIGILTAVAVPAPTAAPDLVVPASILCGSPLGESALHIGFTALFAEDFAAQFMGIALPANPRFTRIFLTLQPFLRDVPQLPANNRFVVVRQIVGRIGLCMGLIFLLILSGQLKYRSGLALFLLIVCSFREEPSHFLTTFKRITGGTG